MDFVSQLGNVKMSPQMTNMHVVLYCGETQSELDVASGTQMNFSVRLSEKS